MCGLAGYARHPDGKDADVAALIGLDLLVAMERRGAHATGIAVFGADDAFICKSAVPARVALESAPWKAALEKIDAKTTIFLGHTRHSTHPTNTRLDEAAHPFHIGDVVGAHNGVIQNWRDVWNEVGNKNQPVWMVDSQAAFGALDAIKDPVKALDLLDGYWALSWVKGDHLFFARTQGWGSPVAVAYVPSMQTLYWSSLMDPLEQILRKAGLEKKDYDAYELGPNNVYRANPLRFDDKGPHMEMKHAPFNGLRTKATKAQLEATSGGKRKPRPEVGGFSASDAVDLLKKHDLILRKMAGEIAKLTDEVAVLRAIAGLTGQHDDETQLRMPV